ncbi:unnamed protein product, partial [Musa hybrid cultivar]
REASAWHQRPARSPLHPASSAPSSSFAGDSPRALELNGPHSPKDSSFIQPTSFFSFGSSTFSSVPMLSFAFPLLLLLLANLFSGLAAPVTGATTDRAALLSVRDRLDPFNALSSWGGGDDYCQWRGVSCDGPGRVTVLDLSELGLSGSISPAIGNLTNLQFLNLSHNHLQGKLPPEFSNLVYLESLLLGSNRLTGEIPAKMGALHKLVILSLHDNNLAGRIPPSLGDLSSLTHLDLGENRLTGTLPSSLASLPALQQLSVTRNNLTGAIPTSIFDLSTVTHLYLGHNQFSGSFPSDMGDMLVHLQVLQANNNNFEGHLPASLPHAGMLREIVLAHNRFSGPVPGDIGNLVHLQSLSVRDNSLEAKTKEDWEFFASLANCKHLHTLDLSHNKLEGELPIPITDLSPQLTFIGLGGNNITNEPTSADLASLRPTLQVDKTAATAVCPDCRDGSIDD